MGASDVTSVGQAYSLEGANMTPSSEDYCLIPLTQGQFAKVSPNRLEELSKTKWCAKWSSNTGTFYDYSNKTVSYRKRISIPMHRVVIGLEYGDQRQVDHINGDTLDNRDDNLRIANHEENQRNRKISKNNTSGYKGVSWKKSRNKWVAKIKAEGKRMDIGYFSSAIEAHMAYCKAAEKYFGEFAREE